VRDILKGDQFSAWGLLLRASAAVCAVLVLVFSVLLIWIPDADTTDYAVVIQAHSITQRELGPALLLAGLVLLAIGGIAVGVIALYASFRVAGPLYRFARNFEAARTRGPLLGVRGNDELQGLSRHVIDSLHAIQRQRNEFDADLCQALAAAQAEGALPPDLRARLLDWRDRVRPE